MSHSLSVDVYCVAGVGNLVGRVTLADGSQHVVDLVDGQCQSSFDARPTHITIEVAPDAEQAPPRERERPADAVAMKAEAVFDQPLVVEESGRLALDIVWGCDCHGEQHVPDRHGKFNSYEHVQCAYSVGYDRVGEGARQLDAPLKITYKTQLDLVPGKDLTFGEILCLAGDFFAHLDEDCAKRFADAWPQSSVSAVLAGSDYRSATLAGASPDTLKELLAVIHGEATDSTTLLDRIDGYPNRRYLALASQNFCHFGDDARSLYRRYHALACERAAAAGNDEAAWMRAIVTEAFGCHFLTDLFATGHLRTPRRALGERFGVLRGALLMSKPMHDEDNREGLWVMTPGSEPRVVWRAYGDGRLALSPDHLRQVREAVRRSYWELCEANAKRAVLPAQRAENLIPEPLPPGTIPLPSDILPTGEHHPPDQAPLNHAPLYVVLPNGHVGQRDGGLACRTYRDLGR